jgi:hypothetical protein
LPANATAFPHRE